MQAWPFQPRTKDRILMSLRSRDSSLASQHFCTSKQDRAWAFTLISLHPIFILAHLILALFCACIVACTLSALRQNSVKSLVSLRNSRRFTECLWGLRERLPYKAHSIFLEKPASYFFFRLPSFTYTLAGDSAFLLILTLHINLPHIASSAAFIPFSQFPQHSLFPLFIM